MPDTIAPPVSRPTTPNTSDTLFLTADTTIAAATTHYGNGLPLHEYDSSRHNGMMLVYLDTAATTLTNNGTLWHVEEAERLGLGDYVIAGLGNVINNGLIVLETDTGSAYAIFAQGHFQNTGEIYALTQDGLAFGYVTEDPFAVVENSGFIGAQSLTGLANTVLLDNGAKLVNHVGGEIIAVGDDATAVVFNRSVYHIVSGDDASPTVLNQGLIEARSLDPAKAATAFYISHLAQEKFELVNEGTIRGDYAFFADGGQFSPYQLAPESITNAASGLIEGTIWLAEGNDVLVNRGTINGTVLLGDGDDLFDGVGGSFTGMADLGFGNDIFYGGNGADHARGETGNDLMEGRGGSDLLLGDWGHDTLIGGAGNDGLYGEVGNDRIVQAGGDAIFGGAGDDRIELFDYTFASIDGESGFDTLRLAGNGRLLDLAAVRSTVRIAGIEAIELGAGDGLVLRAGDVAGFAGASAPLYVSTAAAAGSVQLVGAWTSGSDVTHDGITYATWSLAGETVHVEQGIAVATSASAPGGATGLDAVAGGTAAPLPGVIAGSNRYGNLTLANNVVLRADLEITEDETWFSDNGNLVLSLADFSSPHLVNRGKIISVADNPVTPNQTGFGLVYYHLDVYFDYQGQGVSGGDAMALYSWITDGVDNSGLVYAEASGDGMAIAIFFDRGRIINSERIDAYALAGPAIGAMTFQSGFGAPGTQFVFENTGNFIAFSEEDRAIGAWLENGSGRNDGSISVTGGLGAYGLKLNSVGGFVNTGELVVTTTGTGPEREASVAIFGWFNFGAPLLDNSGTIVAEQLFSNRSHYTDSPYTIVNSGLIQAAVTTQDGRDRLTNSGEIIGDVDLGGRRDFYVNAGGTVDGEISGGAGFDTAQYALARSAYTITYGGNGAITVSGAFGIDQLSGFEYLQFADQTITVDSGEVHEEVGERILWRNANGSFTWWRTTEDLFDGGNSAMLGVDNSWNIAGTGDFDGDNPGAYLRDFQRDILWRNDDGGLAWWRATPTGYDWNTGFYAQVSTAWQVAGTGDFNLDGKSDILWRHSGGAVAVWLKTETGFDTTSFAVTYAATDWQIAGIGYFGSGGVAPGILWHHTSGAVTTWLTQGNGFDTSNAQVLQYAGAGWEIAGLGDFTADHSADIVWRHSSGVVTVWIGTGGGFFTAAPDFDAYVGEDWEIALIGSLDGIYDQDDILWRHESGAVTLWRGTPYGWDADTGIFAPVGNDWQVANDGELLV